MAKGQHWRVEEDPGGAGAAAGATRGGVSPAPRASILAAWLHCCFARYRHGRYLLEGTRGPDVISYECRGLYLSPN